ncbi:hypothetical protein [Priestia megaterium]|uniref:hypothetical protein n=1 Tax=Priestia megaterium TaxID=1404 RepID=UPI0020798407|nr:hypothetical protein [Priestia megaterium]USL27993.1 hypothetical protein LIT33_30235 [Priestia megaterium]
MNEFILFDDYSVEELDILWKKKDFEKIISFSLGKYKNLVESLGKINLQSMEKINDFFSILSNIDDKRFFQYLSQVNIQELELKIFQSKHTNSSREDFIKEKFNKEYIPFEELFRLVEFCFEYEQDSKKSLGYLMRIISTAGDIRADLGYYAYENIVKNYLNELSYFEKRKVKEKQKANSAGLGIFGPKDILDVLDSYTNILQFRDFELDDCTTIEIYKESAEEIISWGGRDTKWIGYQLSKLCQGLLSKQMYVPMYQLITDYHEYKITHKHAYILEIMKNVSNIEILWDCVARMENYIKQNKESKGFNLSVEPARELLKKIVPDIHILIKNNVLLKNMLIRYEGWPFFNEEKIKNEISNLEVFILEQKDKIDRLNSEEILDILYKLTKDFGSFFHEFDGGKSYLEALDDEYYNCRQYKLDYYYKKGEFEIFRYEELEEKVISFRHKIVISYVEDLRKKYLEKLDNASSEEEYNSLRDQLITEIANLINKDINKVIYEGIYKDKEKKLTKIFNGEANWLRLDVNTRDLLISGEIVFEHLINLGDKVDYSAAVIPLTKALENELYIYFHKEIEDYCVANSQTVPTVVREVNNPNLQNKFFSLGSIHFYLKNTEYHHIAIKYLPKEFKGNYIKPYSFSRNGKPITNSFSNDVYHIKEQYRNKVAHKDGIDKETAENCRDYMLLIEKVLWKFINDKI